MSNTCRQCAFNLRAHDSGERSGVAYVRSGLMRQFPQARGLALIPTTDAFHVACLACKSPQIKFLMRQLSVRKHVSRPLHKLLLCQG